MGEELSGPDGGWGWMILVGSFTVSFLSNGLIQSLSPLYISIRMDFNASAEATSWIFSILPCLYFSLAFLGAITAKTWGYRLAVMLGGLLTSLGCFISYFATSVEFLYGTLGVLGGFGLAMSVVPSVTILAVYFPKKHALVNGISMCGGAVCMFTLPPVLQACVDSYGWRGPMLILSAICTHTIVAGALMRPLKHSGEEDGKDESCAQKDDKRDGDGGMKRNTLPKEDQQRCLRCLCVVFMDNSRFALFVVSFFFVSLGMMGGALHLQPRAKAEGVGSLQQTAWLVSIMGISGVVGRLAAGFIVHRKLISPTNVYLLSAMAVGIAFVIPQLAVTYGGFVVLNITMGLGSGAYFSLSIVCAKEYVGIKNLIIALPIGTFISGLGFMLGPPLAGWIYDMTGDYDSSFYTLGCSHFLGVFSCMIGEYINWRRERKEREEETLASQMLTIVECDPDDVTMKDATVQTCDFENTSYCMTDSPYVRPNTTV